MNREVKWSPVKKTLSWGRHEVRTIGLDLEDISPQLDVQLRIINSREALSHTLGIRIPRDANTLNQIGDMFKELAKNV